MIVVWVFGERPLIEKLVHHEKAHAVGQIEKINRRVVSVSDRVGAELSKLSETTLPHRERHGGAKSAAVMMKAHSFDLDVAAVYPKTSRRLEMDFANTEGDGLLVERFVGCFNTYDRLVENAFA